MDLKLKMVRIVSGNHCSIDTRKEQKRNQRQLVRTFNNLVLYMMTKKKKRSCLTNMTEYQKYVSGDEFGLTALQDYNRTEQLR